MSDTILSVEHFRNIIDSETKNLNSMCDKWSKVLSEGAVKEAARDEINDNNGNTNANVDGVAEEQQQEEEDFLGAIRTTIGQAKLLMSQRFKQFSKLIDDCEFKTGPLPTRLDDLAGFWEMISYQVDDVRQKFKYLEEKY